MSGTESAVSVTIGSGETAIRLDGENGRVGIGTEKPENQLEIYTPGAEGSWIRAGGHSLTLQGVNDPTTYDTRLAYIQWLQGDRTRAMFLGWGRTADSAEGPKRVDMFLENGYNLCIQGGRLGIATADPQETLDVAGNIHVSGDILLEGADCAEEFAVDTSWPLEPGTVLVIGNTEELRQCERAYDKRVAGVISGAGECKPGIILGRKVGNLRRMPLALTGKVYCKVDATYASIEVGDLLTTSVTPGHAMKALDPLKAFGAVIGKALRPLSQGQGLIPILVALQ